MSDSNAEQIAHDEILKWCRSTEKGVMRIAPSNPIKGYEWATRYRVLSMGSWDSKPIIAEGDTWCEILEQLSIEED